MAGLPDRVLQQRLRRANARLARQRARGSQRTARTERRVARLEALLALPLDERPTPPRISVDMLRGALTLAGTALAATPAGPLVLGLTGGLAALDKLAKAVRNQDAVAVEDLIASAVAAALDEARLSGAAREDAEEIVLAEIERALDGEA